jgi:hypothetical protein
MIIRAILTLALLAPVVAHADDMFKWRDARGRVHYSNDTEKVPSGAQPVTRQLGFIGGTPIGEAVPPSETKYKPANFPSTGDCVRNLGLFAFPDLPVDLDRRGWFDVEQVCGPQGDIEAWLRRASIDLDMRKIGYK